MDPMLTSSAVATELGIKERTLCNWRSQGLGPEYVKLSPGRGGRIRYARSKVDAWLAQQAAKQLRENQGRAA